MVNSYKKFTLRSLKRNNQKTNIFKYNVRREQVVLKLLPAKGHIVSLYFSTMQVIDRNVQLKRFLETFLIAQ